MPSKPKTRPAKAVLEVYRHHTSSPEIQDDYIGRYDFQNEYPAKLPLLDSTQDFGDHLEFVRKTDLYDLYRVSDLVSLQCWTDKVTMYGVVLKDPMSGKGLKHAIISVFWFQQLISLVPDLKTEFVSADLPENVMTAFKALAEKKDLSKKRLVDRYAYRVVQVHNYSPLPVRSVITGYLRGKLWQQYKDDGQLPAEIELPPKPKEFCRLGKPLWTPYVGEQRISTSECIEAIGSELTQAMRELSVQLYTAAHNYLWHERSHFAIDQASFEFAVDPQSAGARLVLLGPVLTPEKTDYFRASLKTPLLILDRFHAGYGNLKLRIRDRIAAGLDIASDVVFERFDRRKLDNTDMISKFEGFESLRYGNAACLTPGGIKRTCPFRRPLDIWLIIPSGIVCMIVSSLDSVQKLRSRVPKRGL